MEMKRWIRFVPFLTNGKVSIPIECSRYNCGVNPPPGVTVSVLDNVYYIDGLPARIENRMVTDDIVNAIATIK